MQFYVPQFIEIEDKLFGPLSFRQFIYLIGGGGLAYILYRLLPFFIAVIPMILVVGLALALAFYKVNNKPFIFTLQAAFNYILAGKLYVWQKKPRKIKEADEDVLPATMNEAHIPKLSDSKLKELTWSLGVKDSIYKETNEVQGRK